MKQALRRIAVSVYMTALTRSAGLGDRLGWEWLTYNPLVRYSFERAARRNAPKVAEAVLGKFCGMKSVVDVGCGTGGYVAEFQRRGIRAIGCEYSRVSRELAKKKGVTVYPFDLSQSTEPIPGAPFDIAMTLEVGEHIPPFLSSTFVKYLTCLSDVVLFTAAQPGQGGPGHINEKPKSFWVAEFLQCGFPLDHEATEQMATCLRNLGAFEYLPNNLCVFRKASA